jgi:hypothetical protein
MLKAHTPQDNINEMVTTLQNEGVFIIHNFLSSIEIDELYSDVKVLCEDKGGHYEFGRNYRGGHLSQHPKSVIDAFNRPWMKDLSSKYMGKNNYGDNVYATHDFISNKGLARNGWLHFDRGHCFKYFIYLTDVTKNSGAFSCSPGSRLRGSELRKNAWGSNNYNNVKNRIELDYPDILEDYPSIPVEAKRGTLIVFDTDTFHKGGEVEEGKERLVVRLHNYF